MRRWRIRIAFARVATLAATWGCSRDEEAPADRKLSGPSALEESRVWGASRNKAMRCCVSCWRTRRKSHHAGSRCGAVSTSAWRCGEDGRLPGSATARMLAVQMFWMWPGMDYEQVRKSDRTRTASKSRWCAVPHRAIDWVSCSSSQGSLASNYDRSCDREMRGSD
jgi:hypothetical protein